VYDDLEFSVDLLPLVTDEGFEPKRKGTCFLPEFSGGTGKAKKGARGANLLQEESTWSASAGGREN